MQEALLNPNDLYKNNGKHISKVVTVGFAVYIFESFDDFEDNVCGVP